MPGFLKRIVAAALLMAAGSAGLDAQSVTISTVTQSQPWNFTKQAFDANGAPVTAPVAIGQTINYVLSYSPGTTPSGPVTIDDTLSPNLSYVNPSITAPPGWTWTTPPYSVGNQETYSNPGFGPGLSFTVNVPVGGAATTGASAGDGTLPIPVGGRVYGILHHQTAVSAKIMCWDLATFATCSGAPWPLSSSSDLMTPTTVRHIVVGTKIYFPAARAAGTTTTPGIGCWDASTEAPCAFLPLPGGPVWTGVLPPNGFAAPFLENLVSGIVADPSLSRLFMYAADTARPGNSRVYCVPLLVSACAGWASPTNLIASSSSPNWNNGDIMLEETAGVVTRFYVHHSGRVTCLNISNGSACSSAWVNVLPSPAIRGLSLSPVMNAAGTATTQVCLHPYIGALPACFDATTAAQQVLSGGYLAAMTAIGSAGSYVVVAPYRIPGTSRVLYPSPWPSAVSPHCFDFSTGATCTSFAPAWAATNTFRDYGYAVDPLQPDNCLLGLGDAGKPWRFTRSGGTGDKGCTANIEATFDINSFFCAIKPSDPAWTTVEIIGRPTELTGGTITLVNSANATVSTINVGSANSYPVGLPATGANSQLTLNFTPSYTSTPAAGYQLQLKFNADVDPQICYSATVRSCGRVSNTATMSAGGPVPQDKAVAELNFGDAVGEACTPGLLKVCKVAGPGIAIGTPFDFSAGGSTLTVPAGPPPGGTCVVGPSLPVGSAVTVSEFVPAGVTVTGINVAPASQLSGAPNLGGGSVNLIMGTGVTEVTFTNNLTGYIEICKKGDVKGNFSFTVSPGAIGPVSVPAGACSPAIQVIAGTVVIKEVPKPGYTMSGCSAYPAGQQIGCDTSAGTSTVNVAPGNISTMTIAYIENKPAQ
jgi:hypothetical protein